MPCTMIWYHFITQLLSVAASTTEISDLYLNLAKGVEKMLPDKTPL